MDDRGESRRITSSGGREVLVLWFVALAFAGLAAVLALGLLRPDVVSEHPEVPWSWVFWGFVLLTGWTVAETIRRTLAWHRWRGVELELDPWPGSVGGHVGGSLVVPAAPAREDAFRVTLSCLRVVPRKGDRQHREEVVWTRAMEPRTEPAAAGVRLRFTFRVPGELPGTDPAEAGGGPHNKWTLRVFGSVPGVDLDQVYEVPVRRTLEPLHAREPALPDDDLEPDLRDLPAGVVRAEPSREGTALVYPMGRTPALGVMLSVMGAVFAGAPVVMLVLLGRAPPLSEASGLELVMAGVVLTVGGIFGLLGLALLAAGLYSLFNSLEVRLGPDRITSIRRILFVPFRKRVRVADVVGVSASVEGQVGQGARAQVLYAIEARGRSGGTVCLGDSIPGTDLVERVGAIIREETGLKLVMAIETDEEGRLLDGEG